MNKLSVYADSPVDDILDIMLLRDVQTCTLNYTCEDGALVKFDWTTAANNDEPVRHTGLSDPLAKKMESLIDDMHHGYEDGLGGHGMMHFDVSDGCVDAHWDHYVRYLDSEPNSSASLPEEWLNNVREILSGAANMCFISYDTKGSSEHTYTYELEDVEGRFVPLENPAISTALDSMLYTLMRDALVDGPYEDRGGHGLISIDVDHHSQSQWMHFDYVVDEESYYYNVHKDIQDATNTTDYSRPSASRIRI